MKKREENLPNLECFDTAKENPAVSEVATQEAARAQVGSVFEKLLKAVERQAPDTE